MAATARVIEPKDPYPPLGSGEFLMKGLNFPAQGAWGSRHLHVGKRYDFDFGISGVVERIVSLPSGVARAYVREAHDHGLGKLITFLYFPTGTYGPEATE
jgi:hypothetical protein